MIIGCVVYGIQLGWGCVVSGLVCLTSSGFSSGLFFSVGFFSVSGFHCVCVCAWLDVFGVSTGEKKNSSFFAIKYHHKSTLSQLWFHD